MTRAQTVTRERGLAEMQQMKAILRAQDGIKMFELDPSATVTLWQADGLSVPAVLGPNSLLTFVSSIVRGTVQPLRQLIWILKVNWSGTDSESCTIEAHSLRGTRVDESGNTFAIYTQVA